MRLSVLLLTLLALVPLRGPGAAGTEGASLEALIRGADRIVAGEVVAVHELYQRGRRVSRLAWPKRTVLVAEIRVERAPMGPEDLETIWALAARVLEDDRELWKLSPPWEVGDRGVFFLEASLPLAAFEDAIGPRLDATTGGAPLFAWHGPGRIPFVSVDGHEVPDAAGLDVPRGALGGEPSARTARLLDWIDAEVERSTPALRVRQQGAMLVSPASWIVEADGRWTYTVDRHPAGPERPSHDRFFGPGEGKLTPVELERFLALVDEARFLGLPDHVGSSSTLCLSWISLELRTRRGTRRIRWYDGPGDDPAVAADWAYVKQLFEALPRSPFRPR